MLRYNTYALQQQHIQGTQNKTQQNKMNKHTHRKQTPKQRYTKDDTDRDTHTDT